MVTHVKEARARLQPKKRVEMLPVAALEDA